jgi:hypothetical protein
MSKRFFMHANREVYEKLEMQFHSEHVNFMVYIIALFSVKFK